MYLELPVRLKLSYVEVANGTLLIRRLMRFEDMMYELTYSSKRKRCVYCGKKLNKKNKTLDHRYPRDTGGMTITNNLFPCCSKCNSNKSNLTHKEYLKLQQLSKKEQKKYIKNISIYNKKIMRKIGFKLPRKWITWVTSESVIHQSPTDRLRGKNYYKILEFYNQYKKLPHPVIIDKNSRLLDGYNIILFAQDFKIQQIPAIKLENVEIVLD